MLNYQRVNAHFSKSCYALGTSTPAAPWHRHFRQLHRVGPQRCCRRSRAQQGTPSLAFQGRLWRGLGELKSWFNGGLMGFNQQKL